VPVKRRGLVEQVAHELQHRISLGDWTAGSKLPTEPELMALFEVGRSTVREAVKVLAHAGMVTVRQGDGTYVRPLSPTESLERRLRRAAILEVYEVRKALEIEGARLAAARRDETDLAMMADALARRAAAKKIDDEAEFVEADIAFHQAIAVASKNAVLADLYRAFTSALRNAITAEKTGTMSSRSATPPGFIAPCSAPSSTRIRPAPPAPSIRSWVEHSSTSEP
jgi:DNA-binding FadR family transcriptional regulator